jgi:hypothetical protein
VGELAAVAEKALKGRQIPAVLFVIRHRHPVEVRPDALYHSPGYAVQRCCHLHSKSFLRRDFHWQAPQYPL